MTITSSRLSRRAVTALPLAAVFGLAACSSETAESTGGEGGAGQDSPAEQLLPEGDGTTEYPLTLSTWTGESVLDRRPARIATIGFSINVDMLQALGVTPVYTITEDAEYAWRDQEWFSAIEVIDSVTRRDPVNIEGIAATAPDLILAMNSLVDEGEFDRLSDIAPVLDVESTDQLGDRFDWREAQRAVGAALDLAEAAQSVIDGAEQSISEVAAAHPEFEGRTVTIGSDYGGQYELEYYTTTGGTAESVMSELGFSPNPLAEHFTEDAVVSAENISLMDADALVVTYADQETRQAREGQALFQDLPPVVDGRYVSLTVSEEDPTLLVTPEGVEKPNPTWVLRRGASAVSLPWAVDVLANEWLAGIDLA